MAFAHKLLPLLEPIFPGTTHVVLHGLDRHDDDTLREFARAGGFTVLTKGSMPDERTHSNG